ncbi:putative methyltransferase PMT26 [Raphanus sativus]|uniref:Probable methyltransferase PMT26 n=1 Tax=Raphanus sativus TaxID=3726 RepID=A0A6J0NXQ8_RAPSA|nr:probable methyltransferase PMT26 [Raphanus sativus]KAJ4897312.1 putative methyltransferase PMT26 [Raphanus sativus]
MAQVRYTRLDNRRPPSSYCSTVMVVVFVALCLVGIWMMTSSYVGPAQDVDEVSLDTKDGIKKQMTPPAAEEGSGQKSEDGAGETLNEEKKGDGDEGLPEGDGSSSKQEGQEEKKDEKAKEESTLSGDESSSKQWEQEEKKEEKTKEEATSSGDESSSKQEDQEEKKEEDTKGESTSPSDESSSKQVDQEQKKEENTKEESTSSSDESSSKQVDQEEKKEENTKEEPTSSGETKSETEGGENKNEDTKSENGDGSDLGEKKDLKDDPDEENQNDDSKSENGDGSDLGEKKDLKDHPDEENPDSNDKQTKPETEDNESSEDSENQKKKTADESDTEAKGDKETKTGTEGAETKTEKESTETIVEQESQPKNETSGDLSPPGAQLELLNETTAQNGSFTTQATESKIEKEAQKSSGDQIDFKWTLCNTTAGPDYIPCLDNVQAIKSLKDTKHYEHRERHCPDSPPTCLVPLPEGYKRPIEWPKSREKIWYTNVPHTKLAEYKGHQNWVKVTGEFLTFPGGGTQFKHGALHYIDFIQESVPGIEWGKSSRVVLDVGCGVASFGGFLFDRDVVTMSLAPKDEHEAQVQFALERGIPAISAVMGTTRLPFPGRVFDIVHCARCRVPWHIEGGKLLLELNRVLRPGGFFVWSATPVYQKKTEDVEIWKAMTELTKKMCWELISINKDTINGVGVATYKKPTSNECYKGRSEQQPPICADSDDPNASWKVPLEACMHTAPEDTTQRGSQWPEQWPARLEKPPFWLSSSQTGVYGKAAPDDFTADYEHWKRVVTKSYLNGLGINWASVRNVMDMKAVYGGFAAALRDMKVWVMNVVPIDSPDTLAIIYERGLFGIYHDWCESFSTYPRSYDLVHADHLFSKLKQRCNLTAVVAEVDRVLRPEGKMIVRDDAKTVQEVEAMVKAMKWEVHMTYSKGKEGLLTVQKSIWRPADVQTLAYAIAA